MCGIAAIIKLDGSAGGEPDLRRMASTLHHRGPDGAGFARLNLDGADGSILLGHTRLSIIDLEGGHQPLWSASGQSCITFNGEIYDYQAHRELLISQGVRFRTRSDTEVILALYEQHGMGFLERLNGEFAFVLYDARERRLIAARDRHGVKPLFYARREGELLIASEAKAILALARVDRRLSSDYLLAALGGVFPRDLSPFEGIQSLKPGHSFIVTARDAGPELPYWRPSFRVDDRMSLQDAREGVRETFRAAVRRRMVADVPVGTYLSGGVDSTLVCALAAESSPRVRAFNVGFENPELDESAFAREIAARCGAEFETVLCPTETLAERFDESLAIVEMPVFNPSFVAKQVLSGLVRSRGYKVCLTGEGSDETQGGYPPFKLELLWRMLRQGGESARQARAIFPHFRRQEALSRGVFWTDDPVWKGPLALGTPSFAEYRARRAARFLPPLLSPAVNQSAMRWKNPHQAFLAQYGIERVGGLDPFNLTRLINFDQLSAYLIPTLGDRVEMANSVECRTPFLDRDYVAFCETVPPAHFLSLPELGEKRLLKEAFSGELSPIFARQKKHPFVAPNWRAVSRTTAGRALFEQRLSDKAIARAGLFNPSAAFWLRNAWSLLGGGASPWSQRLDLFVGGALCVQSLHELFVARPIASNAAYEMTNFSRGQNNANTA